MTEGLLDLLTEPAPQSTEPAAGAQGSAANAQANAVPSAAADAAPTAPAPPGGGRGMGAKDWHAEDLGGGEDLGARGSNPLAEVRLGMLTAAGWLRDHSAVDKTEQLQRDIVARLDQLIADLNQQPPAPAPPADAQTPPSSQQTQQRQAQEAAAKEAEARKQARQQQARRSPESSQEMQADASGTEGQPAPGAAERKGVVVDLNDPTALQRSAWGNLPDRVREQMQSRMVERFLPGYREAIEAYYRALSR